MLEEELADVDVCICEVEGIRPARMERIKREKRIRWLRRLGGD